MKVMKLNNSHMELLSNVFVEWNIDIALDYYKHPFQNPDWDILYIYSAPAIDMDSYPFFIKFFSLINEDKFYTVPISYDIEDKLLENDITENHARYDEGLQESFLRYDDCLIFGNNPCWGISCMIDTEILSFGFDRSLKDIVEKIFRKNKFILTQELADEVNSMLHKGITYDKERIIKKIKVANKQQTD
ncbi:hypothetical protein [Paraprevotella clara]|uniref:hypothetical protein n=1 Tax=Paraprevotella clara TaxID=454154 RepID=UPI003AB47187